MIALASFALSASLSSRRSIERHKRRPSVYGFDVEAGRSCERCRDGLQFLLRDHIVDASKAVGGTFFNELQCSFGSKPAIAQCEIAHDGPTLPFVMLQPI